MDVGSGWRGIKAALESGAPGTRGGRAPWQLQEARLAQFQQVEAQGRRRVERVGKREVAVQVELIGQQGRPIAQGHGQVR